MRIVHIGDKIIHTTLESSIMQYMPHVFVEELWVVILVPLM